MNETYHIEITEALAGIKLIDLLCEKIPLSKQKIKQAMQKGACWFEQGKSIRRVRRGDKPPVLGAVIHLYYNSAVLDVCPPTPTLISDELDFSVWYKPYGMLCQGSKWGDHCTINRWIEMQAPFTENSQRDCIIVHRLDRAARGLIIIAHKRQIAAKFTALFEKQEIVKEYRVIVEGEFPLGEQLFEVPIDGKPASTLVSPLEYSAEQNRTLLAVKISSGRKHQIRLHLSQAGFPVVGDRLHGGNDVASELDLQLSAYHLSFTCPVNGADRIYYLPKALQLSLASCST